MQGSMDSASHDLPKTVVMKLDQGSFVTSMDFHPVQQTLLLVGTNSGEIKIWNLGTREKLVDKEFKVSCFGVCSVALKEFLNKGNKPSVTRVAWSPDGKLFGNKPSVTRVAWSPDGKLFGVAYSMHLTHVYSYHGGGDVRFHLEIEPHRGGVNDLALCYPNFFTCGDDMVIKVWNTTTGANQNTFSGHKAPVYCVCPDLKKNNQFISTAIDGKMKLWSEDKDDSIAEYDAPGHSPTKMTYSDDGKRLFSCGTSTDGESFLIEWNLSEGAVIRNYNGLRRPTIGVVQFHTTKNRIIAAGDEGLIKFWDMDNANLLTTIDADGGLPASPCIRFDKGGMLLAVATRDNDIKILANPDGIKLMENPR